MNHVSVMIKPVSGGCNMRCSYCFYRDMASQRQETLWGVMSIETLEQVVKQVMKSAQRSCSFVFQGGEPTLVGLDFFHTFIKIQERYAAENGLEVQNAIQTNGLALDEEWAEFLGANQFLVGLSVDGTKEIHDYLRPDNLDKGTYTRINHAALLLKKYHVDFNILTVLTRQTAHSIQKIYQSYRKNGWDYMQFIPCLDPYEEERGSYPWSLTPKDYGKCLETLFDCWYRDMREGNYVSIRYFDNLLDMMMGNQPESCGLLGFCPSQMVVESDGSVYPCDFYVTKERACGNLRENSVTEVISSIQAQHFQNEAVTPDSDCLKCRWAYLCRGGCRRDRDTKGVLGKNYYCSSYQKFFAYAESRLHELVNN